MNHFLKHDILCDNQHGFTARRSIETQLITTLQGITSKLRSGKDQIDVIRLDFLKAFDKVPHQRLLHKSDFYGVRDDTLRWIQSFLHYRKQQVLLVGSISAEADVLSGVPQGTVLGLFYSSHLLMTFQSLQRPILCFSPMMRCFIDISRVIMMRDFSNKT